MINGLKEDRKRTVTYRIWERHAFSFVNFERIKKEQLLNPVGSSLRIQTRLFPVRKPEVSSPCSRKPGFGSK